MNIENLKFCIHTGQTNFICYYHTYIIFDGDHINKDPRVLSEKSLMINMDDRRGMDYA